VQTDGSVEVFPGQVQYYFEHEVILQKKRQTHKLAYVKWFMPVSTYQTRFHLRIDDDDTRSCNVEIWSNDFCDTGRDCIIPVHNILDRFIPSKYEIGRKKPVVRMAVIPIERKFHM
jgi:hypothetical protein